MKKSRRKMPLTSNAAARERARRTALQRALKPLLDHAAPAVALAQDIAARRGTPAEWQAQARRIVGWSA